MDGDQGKKCINKVAAKFNIIISVIKILGYFGAFLCLIIGITKTSNYIFGLWIGAIVSIITWLSTIFLEAIAEGLQLLEDIKNKL